MEKNRQGIGKILAPSAVLTRQMLKGELGERGFADGLLTVVGKLIEPDQDGNDTMKYVLEVKTIEKLDMAKARVW